MRILHSNSAGELKVTIPAPKYMQHLRDTANREVTDAEIMAHIAAKDVPNGRAFEVVEDSDVPSDRTFRNAWEHDTSAAPEKVKTNMDKAKLIAHDMRRADRDEAFRPLDVQATIPAQASAAETARQAIRDADAVKQLDIDAATDEEALKALVA